MFYPRIRWRHGSSSTLADDFPDFGAQVFIHGARFMFPLADLSPSRNGLRKFLYPKDFLPESTRKKEWIISGKCPSTILQHEAK